MEKKKNIKKCNIELFNSKQLNISVLGYLLYL